MKFRIKNYCYIKSENEIDVSFLPPLVRRRLSLLNKAVLTTMAKVFRPDTEEIVFSSQYGEFTRLDMLIAQYKECGEVSPAQFSASVHNYSAGFFTLFNKLNIPYYALSAGDNSFQSGIIKSAISEKETMYTYADVYNGIKSISLLISPAKGNLISFNNENFDNFVEKLTRL